MVDEITGISVLQPTWVNGIFRLWFYASRRDSRASQGWIFIQNQEALAGCDKMPGYPEGTNSIWNFKRRGDYLDVTPSVNWLSWDFHNAGQWTTEYVEMPWAERAESKAGPEPTRVMEASKIHYELNFCKFDRNQQTVLINELRSQGHLKSNRF